MTQNAKSRTAAPCLTDGLIIREFNGVGEADRFITVLTRARGVVRASVRGARRISSRSGSATGLLCYSRLRLLAGRDAYIVADAQPIEIFFNLRNDIEKMALAQYFCELAGALCAAEEPSEEPLRLLLNALQYLQTDTRPPLFLKAVVEWRLLSLAGYMPDTAGCAVCGRQADLMRFFPLDGRMFCPSCAPAEGIALPAGAAAAVRHVTLCPPHRCFAFTLSDQTLKIFADVAEQFLKAQLGRSFKTLDFYHELSNGG